MFVFDEQTKYALFKGIEQEGPKKGTLTLFIHKKVPREDIEREAVAHGISVLYFGAGFLSEYCIEDADYFLSKGYEVTVESIEMPEGHESRTGDYLWMCPVAWQGATTKNLKRLAELPNKEHVLVKIDTGHSTAVIPLTQLFTSDYADYSGDEMLIHVKDTK